MRTTLTLDEDVAAKLRAEARRSGESFKSAVNRYLRLGLDQGSRARPRKPFKVKAGPLRLREGLRLDCISQLIDDLETADRR